MNGIEESLALMKILLQWKWLLTMQRQTFLVIKMTILGGGNMMGNHEKYMISMLCYELYKVDWKHKHMITADREMDSIKNYYEALAEVGLDDESYAYHYYLEEFGYDGELYVCYEEFWENEYRDDDYMCSLLDNEKLIAMYHKAIKE